jgi:peptide/nickel transport system ATP-binding protein
MTQQGVTAQPPATATPLLEARDITKHFAVHDAVSLGRAVHGVRRGLRGGGVHHGRGYGGAVVHAVDDVSIALAAARVTALVGESGSGKSTLARVLARLLYPTSGQLLLEGRPVRASGRRRLEYARQVQMVLQDPFSSLNPVHEVRYHLARPLQVHDLQPPGTSLDEVIKGLLERVALSPADQFIRKYPHELSGGQRQRVAIARALAVRPRVLLADEPVSMLDVSIRLGILNLLRDLSEQDQLAILYITHDIASARYLADTIAVMYAGQVVESGPAQDVTDQPAHPYTQLLLSAAPDPDRVAQDGPGQPRLGRRGTPPSLVSPPSGCRFHPRCPHAMAVCSDASPPAFEVAAGHVSACWLHATDLDAEQARPASPATPQASATERDPASDTDIATTPRREGSGASESARTAGAARRELMNPDGP